jgi:hypothetical protein
VATGASSPGDYISLVLDDLAKISGPIP